MKPKIQQKLDQFYKIIYDAKNQKMFAYLMPNKKIESREKYVVTVDSIEALTGIDFYHELDDELENKLESTKNNLQILKFIHPI